MQEKRKEMIKGKEKKELIKQFRIKLIKDGMTMTEFCKKNNIDLGYFRNLISYAHLYGQPRDAILKYVNDGGTA